MASVTRRDALKLAGLTLPLAAAGAAAARAPGPRKYLILSLDGGGIRGLLTAKIIAKLQAEVPFLDRVELFAGTSTGGILALGLANQVTPERLVGLYRDRGPEIFNKNEPKPPTAGLLNRWLGAITDKTQEFLNSFQFRPQDLVHPKYPNEGLARVLTEFFGDATFGTLKSGKSALVTTFRLYSEAKEWAPLVLHNLAVERPEFETRLQDGPTPGMKLIDAALATSAAPLYFPPHEAPGFGYCVDGGLFANCPASIAFGLALRSNPAVYDQVRILSIGTGAQTSGIDIRNSQPFAKPSDYGALAWLDPIDRGEKIGPAEQLTPGFPLISALFDASSASHNYICSQALGAKYRRVQVNLARPIALDDTSKRSLDALEAAADSIPAAEWKATTDWLKQQIA